MASRAWDDWVPPSAKAPTLVPAFGPRPGWEPGRTCEDVHPHGPIPEGSAIVCMCCLKSGVDHYESVRTHVKHGDGTVREGWPETARIADVGGPTRHRPARDAKGRPLKGGRGR